MEALVLTGGAGLLALAVFTVTRLLNPPSLRTRPRAGLVEDARPSDGWHGEGHDGGGDGGGGGD